MINKLKLNILFIFLVSLLFCFASCKVKAEQKSLVDQFVVVDNFIDLNEIDSAMAELQKAEKKANDKWSYLGIYKRYIRLNKTEAAENIIRKGIKSHPDCNELRAVYTKFLIENNRLDDAEDYGKKLAGTEYESFYSEAILKKFMNMPAGDKLSDFYNVYYTAYLTSKNPVWIKNCAIIDLELGRFDRISSLVPSSFADVDDAYFWALALYDSGNYYEAIDVLEKVYDIRENYNGLGDFKTTEIEQIALLSDAYMAVSDMDSAENVRRKVLINIDNLNNDISERELSLLPVIISNSARWAYNQEDYDRCADLLFYVVNKWPDYIPGLILYTDFAYNSNLERNENSEMLALRKAGLATVEMERYDNRRKIPISDAKYRVESALKRTNDPYLNIIQLDLKYKTDSSLTKKDKNRDLWNMLENSYEASSEYKALLIQYALNSLLSTKQYDDAWDLFQSYVLGISNFDIEDDFWKQFIDNIHNYDNGIIEFAAWFAAFKQMSDEALNLYEYYIYDNENVSNDKNNNDYISPSVSTAACMNLANIYESVGNVNKALDLYGRIGGRESKKPLRSEIFYRIACIYSKLGDNKNALRSVEYAYELYPENIRASLLKDNLKGED